MYYSSDFKREQQSSRFDRWRVNYDLLLRIIDAKEEMSSKQTIKSNQSNDERANQGRVR